MTPPTRFCVQYGDRSRYARELARQEGIEDCTEPHRYMVERDFARLSDARRFAAPRPRVGGMAATVYERRDLRDVTPPCDPPWALWDSEDVAVWP